MEIIGIKVVFAGLMLICHPGDNDCPRGGGINTAWVVKAQPPDDDNNKPCGWESQGLNYTTLKVRYMKDEYECEYNGGSCDAYCQPEFEGTNTDCDLPNGKIELAVDNSKLTRNKIRSSTGLLIRLNEIDGRFKKINASRLQYPYVTASIEFPFGDISAESMWPLRLDPKGRLTDWYLSKGLAQFGPAHRFSDRLAAKYSNSTYLIISAGAVTMKFKVRREGAPITIVNEANALSGESKNGITDLPYLLWYNRLGEWNNDTGECPDYSKQAVLLRCKTEGCYYYLTTKRNTTFWPVMRNGKR